MIRWHNRDHHRVAGLSLGLLTRLHRPSKLPRLASSSLPARCVRQILHHFGKNIP
ncbi:MAG: hypothetical protein ABIO42_16695 [Burkholderiaceae bacterium]|jgi:hypothetical protein